MPSLKDHLLLRKVLHATSLWLGGGIVMMGSVALIAKEIPTKPKTEELIFLSNEPFAAGEFRWAFKGQLKSPKTKTTQSVVIKVFKPEFSELYPNEGISAIRSQEKSQELALIYNRSKPRNPKIYFLPLRAMEMPRDMIGPDGKIIIKKGTELIVEPMLDGTFEKFSSNDGWVRNDIMCPGAFSHWTWHQTHELIVCDLQGTRSGQEGGGLGHGKEGTYVLTDPAICSLSRDYGATDGGPRAVDAFFRMHVCNAFCAGFISDRPRLKIKNWKRHRPSSNTRFMIHETVPRSKAGEIAVVNF